jgi:hypothetical protein
VPFYRQRAVRGTAHLRCEAKEGTKEGPGRGRRMGRQPADVGGLSAGACGEATRGGRGLQGAWTTCSLGSHGLWHGTKWEGPDTEAVGTTRRGRVRRHAVLGRGVAHFYFIYTSLTEKMSKNSNKTPQNFQYQSCRA